LGATRDGGSSHYVDPTTYRPRLVVASVQGVKSLPPERVPELQARADVTFEARDHRLTPDEAVETFADADLIAVTPKVSPDLTDDLLSRLPRLRGVALHATGYDFVDLTALQRHGVVLSTLPEYSTRSVAEATMALLLSVSSRAHLGNDRSRGVVPRTTSLRGFELAGRTLGILGCGRIGSTVAGLAQGFGMTTIAYDIDPKPVPGVLHVARDELFARSDVLTLHCPLAFGAPPLVGEAELRRMPAGAVVVNSSRSALIDRDALVAAIRDGHLRGYAVDDDVFRDDDEVADLLREGRILQTGHSAWWTDEVLVRGAHMWADAIEALIADRPIDVIDPRTDATATATASEPAVTGGPRADAPAGEAAANGSHRDGERTATDTTDTTDANDANDANDATDRTGRAHATVGDERR
jgi:phosphoglycerate dehydrogenase-like enzyme